MVCEIPILNVPGWTLGGDKAAQRPCPGSLGALGIALCHAVPAFMALIDFKTSK